MKRVLWIEDGAETEVAHLAGPVRTHGDFFLHIALDASTGLDYILRYQYEAVVVDIRLLPGKNQEWREIYINRRQDTVRSRLGIELLRTLFRSKHAILSLDTVPTWVLPNRFGILSVEEYESLKADFEEMNLIPEHYQQKIIASDKNALLDLLNVIVK